LLFFLVSVNNYQILLLPPPIIVVVVRRRRVNDKDQFPAKTLPRG
jgi:hypothetical protein